MPGFPALRARLSSPAAEPNSEYVKTAVSVMLAPGEKGLDILLIRRAVRVEDPWSGHIGLPGGRHEPGDAGLLETAVRETREEIGVNLSSDALLGTLPDLAPSMPSRPPLVIRPFVFGLNERPRTENSSEVDETYWVPLADLGASRGTSHVMIHGRSIEVPCFRPSCLPDGRVVWGLTYRILDGLLPLISA